MSLTGKYEIPAPGSSVPGSPFGRENMKAKGIAATILSALLFGFTPVLASKTYDMGSTPETLTFYRNLLVVPILFLILLIRREDFRLSGRTLSCVVLFGVLGRGATTLMLYSAYPYAGIGISTTLHFLYPVFVALLCRIFFKERLGLVKSAVLVMAVCGILFFLEKGQSGALTGIILAVVSGFTYALYMVGLDKTRLKDISPYKNSFYMAIAVAAGMLLYNIPTRKIVFALPPKAFAYTLVIAVCTSLLAVILLQVGIRYLSATTAAIFCLFEPISCSVSGWLFLGEEIRWQKIVGSLLILAAAAILMAVKEPCRPRRKASAG